MRLQKTGYHRLLWTYRRTKMYQVYLAFGYHNIYNYTEEQFAEAKKFYKLFQIAENLYGNKRGDIFAWRKEN